MATPATTATPVASGRAGTPALVGMVCALAAGAMLTTAVCGAYLSVRNRSGRDFVPAAMPFNNYVAVMITITLAFASTAAGWAVVSMRTGNRRWASSGFGFSAFLGLAALNLLWFLGNDVKLSVDSSPYAVLFYGMLTVAGLALVFGLVSSLLGCLRVLGGQATAEEPHYGLISQWGQHLALVSWIAIYATIYWLK